MSALLNFRTVYLQAIAKAWNDPTFHEKLVTVPENAVPPDYGGDKFSLLEKTFNYQSPFVNLFLAIVDPGPQGTHWDTQFDLEWIGEDGLFTIKIPKTPPKEDQPEALATYYRNFPTFIGLNHHKKEVVSLEGEEPRDTSFPMGRAEVQPDVLNSGVSKVASGHSLGSHLANLGGVTLQVIALAWRDPNFAYNIIRTADASAQLSVYFGYNNPFNYFIRFELDESFVWTPATETALGHWPDPIPKNIVVLNFPKKPPEGVDLPIALTQYNNTGPAYPFTCS